jgi:hypothetical protein
MNIELANRALLYLRRSRVQIGLARAAATAPIRVLDPSNPDSWEFSAFSASGEDGIIDYLTRRMLDPEFTFLEIGASDGVANNTAWLAIARKWRGVMIDGDESSIRSAKTTLSWFNPMVEVAQLMVTDRNVDAVLSLADTKTPDVFSLDVDSVDYYVARALFDRGLRPRLCVVEYNSAYGPDLRCTVKPELVGSSHEALYYGVSIAGWRSFFDSHGYTFIGVERTGVNAFFVDPASFDRDFLGGVRGCPFRENALQRRAAGPWERQLERVQRLGTVEIP